MGEPVADDLERVVHGQLFALARRAHAALYDDLLTDVSCGTPMVSNEDRHVYHVYSVLVDDRQRVQKVLGDAGVGSNIHYPIPVHMQQAHADLGCGKGDFPVSEKLAQQFLSLPMYAELTDDQIRRTVDVLRDAMNG